MMQELITANAITKFYHDRPILQGVSLTLNAGQVVTLIGPNGAGKSTLLRILVGLERADTGEITRKEGLRVGYVPQQFALNEALPMNVKQFLMYFCTQPQPRVRLHEVAKLLGIDEVLCLSMHRLSGGELRRVLLARAILNRPELLILDEPLAGVDVTGQAEIYRLIQSIVDEVGCGVLMVSHDLHVVMASTHHVICLNHHVCCEGEPRLLGENPEFARLFGAEMAASLALYSHAHDHCHDLHGDVLEACEHEH